MGVDGEPVKDFGRLVYQASVVDDLFETKTRDWAAESGGAYKHARLKSSERALEKTFRAYGNDPSRLLDLSRRSILFRTLEEMHRCVELLRDDPDVACVRIKNRLDLGYDSAESAGYRDIAVNLRLATTRAQTLGVEGHVVELQLMLHDFATLKSDGGHARYKEFRNERGD